MAIARGDDVDVIEIDGASNRGIDEIRELRANAIYRPARCRYKIYIIDEVHMLTKEAFNALLKTLEEPPAHVKFIFATTEPHKVPATILSRCQRFDFRNIPTRQIAEHLARHLQGREGQGRRRRPVPHRPRGGRLDARRPEPAGPAALGRRRARSATTDVVRVLGTPPDERTAGDRRGHRRGRRRPRPWRNWTRCWRRRDAGVGRRAPWARCSAT